jgi:hypothetical protein
MNFILATLPPLPGGERIEVRGPHVRGFPLPSNPLTLPSPPRGEGFEVRL